MRFRVTATTANCDIKNMSFNSLHQIEHCFQPKKHKQFRALAYFIHFNFYSLDCEQCDDFYYGECPKHTFNIIEDSNMATENMSPNAMKSLPENLYVKVSPIPEAGMGVFTNEKLEVNTRFGPYRGVKVLKQDLEDGRNTSYMWEVLEDRHY